VVLACFGCLALIAFASSGSWENFLIALVLTVIFVLAAIAKKIRYTVHLTAAGGEADALISDKRGYIESVVAAVNQAMVKRG
jgi:hypothetical protein